MAEAKKKKNRHIAYFIFIGICAFILGWLILKKINMPEEKPLKSLPGERPSTDPGYRIIEGNDNDTIYADEISLLSPELPKVRVTDPIIPPSYNDYDEENDADEYDDYSAYVPSTASVPVAAPSLKLTTEQSVRNMLISNRFVDPESSDVITFTNNGNVLLRNGEAQTSEMEVDQLSGNLAILNFYDDNNTSWDVQLDVSGETKKIRMMDVTYTAN